MASVYEQLFIDNASAPKPPHPLLRGGKNAPGDTLTIESLLEAVDTAANIIEDMQARSIALFADNSPRWVVIDLACQKLGVIFAPLPLFFCAAQIQHAIHTSGVDLLLSDQPHALEALMPEGHQFETRIAGYHATFRRPQKRPLLPLGTDKVTFTSGSTGQPKGACLTNNQQLAVAHALSQTVNIGQIKHLSVLPLSTLLENVAGIYGPLLTAGEVIIPSLKELGFNGSTAIDSQLFLAAISRYAPQSLILLPQLLKILVTAIELGYSVPPQLAFIAVGGAKVSPDLVHKARALGLPVYEGYGLSECASVVSLNTPSCDHVGTVGPVLPHTNAHTQNGEIVVTGSTFLGYAGEPASWYPEVVFTGDVGHIDSEGFVHISGRKKHMVITSFGRNISPEWVESELLASANIAFAIVVGEAKPYCSALIFPISDAVPSRAIDEWLAEINQKLPDYARITQWRRCGLAQLSQHQLITNNGRPKREAIIQHYHSAIEECYYKTHTGIAQ